MTRRPAVTLMEVLIAMFIMAIGMMALLALFPVGAVTMATALKDDRCAYASLMSENVAIANNVRYGDANVFLALGNLNLALGIPNSGLTYVDPYAVIQSPSAVPAFGVPLGRGVGGIPLIPRVAPTFAYYVPPPPAPQTPILTTPIIDRWFSLADDMSFNLSGTPDTSNTGGTIANPIIDRGRRYSYAYLLRQQPPLWSKIQSTMKSVQLYAVVYQGRPVNSLTINPVNNELTGEWTYNATNLGLPPGTPLGLAGTNSITLPSGTTVKRGGWILDTSIDPNTGQGNGYFYRVTNVAEIGTTTVEVQQTLLANVTQATVMDFVAEVFDKGYGWQQ